MGWVPLCRQPGADCKGLPLHHWPCPDWGIPCQVSSRRADLVPVLYPSTADKRLSAPCLPSAWRSGHADQKITETELNHNCCNWTCGHGPSGYSTCLVMVRWSQDGQPNHSRPVTTGLELNLWSCLYVVNKSINVVYHIDNIYYNIPIYKKWVAPRWKIWNVSHLNSPGWAWTICTCLLTWHAFHLLVFIYMFGLVVVVDQCLSHWSTTTTVLPLTLLPRVPCHMQNLFGPQVSLFTSFRKWLTFFLFCF